ncbi:hypothetical protein SAMN04489708_12574 [Paracidovorax cattleyae]|uniref:DUF3649 domain-containing protein n=2 Tax=Paracidovorax cattleyae TaxID=80868 RepID=A0A1H0VEY3_9BURK|nr:hypothetical protein SAMN04489708_12574 [Paracidovorax cattleyae]
MRRAFPGGSANHMKNPLNDLPLINRVSPYQWSVLARVFAGTIGAYLASALSAYLLAMVYVAAGSSRADAVAASTLLAFLIQVVAVVMVFACSSTLKAVRSIAILLVILAIAAWINAPIRP